MLRQQRNVLLAFAQRGDLNRKDIETVIKVFPEPARGHVLLQIPVGGGDDAHIGAPGAVFADPLITLFLQRPQQFALQFQGTSPISSRNSVPPSAVSKRPARSLIAPVKAPLAWPKNSLSNRSLGMDAQLTRTSGRLCAGCDGGFRARPVPCPCRFRQDENRSFGRGDQVNLADDLPQRRALADQVAESFGFHDFFLQVGVLHAPAAP